MCAFCFSTCHIYNCKKRGVRYIAAAVFQEHTQGTRWRLQKRRATASPRVYINILCSCCGFVLTAFLCYILFASLLFVPFPVLLSPVLLLPPQVSPNHQNTVRQGPRGLPGHDRVSRCASLPPIFGAARRRRRSGRQATERQGRRQPRKGVLEGQGGRGAPGIGAVCRGRRRWGRGRGERVRYGDGGGAGDVRCPRYRVFDGEAAFLLGGVLACVCMCLCVFCFCGVTFFLAFFVSHDRI